MITSKEWVDRLQTLASWHSLYQNKYPYNLLYWDGQRYWADCVNLLKALFNGRDIYDKTTGSFQRDLSFTGDINEWQMINACEYVSNDFTILGELPEVLYMSGHIGTYLGKEVVVDGTIRNVIECTPAWEDGIIYSYVDALGRRSHHKGGATTNKPWEKHGYPTRWVQYMSEGQKFKDVGTDRSSYKAIQWMAEQGYIKGYDDGTFRPESPLTREQYCIIEWRKAGKP